MLFQPESDAPSTNELNLLSAPQEESWGKEKDDYYADTGGWCQLSIDPSSEFKNVASPFDDIGYLDSGIAAKGSFKMSKTEYISRTTTKAPSLGKLTESSNKIEPVKPSKNKSTNPNLSKNSFGLSTLGAFKSSSKNSSKHKSRTMGEKLSNIMRSKGENKPSKEEGIITSLQAENKDLSRENQVLEAKVAEMSLALARHTALQEWSSMEELANATTKLCQIKSLFELQGREIHQLHLKLGMQNVVENSLGQGCMNEPFPPPPLSATERKVRTTPAPSTRKILAKAGGQSSSKSLPGTRRKMTEVKTNEEANDLAPPPPRAESPNGYSPPDGTRTKSPGRRAIRSKSPGTRRKLKTGASFGKISLDRHHQNSSDGDRETVSSALEKALGSSMDFTFEDLPPPSLPSSKPGKKNNPALSKPQCKSVI
jgi:hypothetical protein